MPQYVKLTIVDGRDLHLPTPFGFEAASDKGSLVYFGSKLFPVRETPDQICRLLGIGSMEQARESSWDDAVTALREAKPELRERPTIEELEKILHAPAPAIHINPDGSISSGSPFASAADWLAANKPKE